MKNKKLLGVGLFVALIAVMACLFFAFRAKPVEGSKAITIEVVNSLEEATVYEVHTDAEFLQQAMDEAEGLTYSGTESEYGIMVDTVNEEVADYAANGAYWAFYVNEEYCNYGISEQPILDGDAFKIVYTAAQ